jgi:hypothetical protein
VPYLSLGVEYMDILCSSLAAVAPKLITAIAGYDMKKSRTNENKIQNVIDVMVFDDLW